MVSISQIPILSDFVFEIDRNPRISVRELHKRQKHYKNRASTSKFLKNLYAEEILFGPKIWCNSGFEVKLYEKLEDPLLTLERKSTRADVNYLIALIGRVSLICFKNGASMIEHAEPIKPSLPAEMSIEDITLEEKGELPNDEYPGLWDEKDWDIFRMMRNPRVSYAKVAGTLGMPWQTVRDRFKKIVTSCKTWLVVLPRGYYNYQQSILIFETDYEANLRNELSKLDRTSIIYKFNGKIILHMYLDRTLQNTVFYKLRREKKIKKLTVCTPIGWYSPHW